MGPNKITAWENTSIGYPGLCGDTLNNSRMNSGHVSLSICTVLQLYTSGDSEGDNVFNNHTKMETFPAKEYKPC